MIRRVPRILEGCRKTAISIFVLFHFSAVILWIIPPYSEMIEQFTTADSLAGRLERGLMATLPMRGTEFGSRLIDAYIDLIGAHQYWDFFAPEIPRVHRYLSVCSSVQDLPETEGIACIGPLYRSFEGPVEDAARPHQGKRSRSYRLVENLMRLHRPELFEAFTMYWRKKQDPDAAGSTFLLLHEYTLQPGKRDVEQANKHRDEVIWIAPG
ncbi:MAG: hypothetical protein ACU843_04370 [Gammaproteobacteria bacterium]